MTRYHTSPFLPLAGLLLGAIFVLLLFSGCATTGDGDVPTLQEVRDSACPIVEGVVIGLQVEPVIDQKTRDELAAIQPKVQMACASTGTQADLKMMLVSVFPMVLDIVQMSDLTPEQKQATIIALTATKLLILNYKQQQ